MAAFAAAFVLVCALAVAPLSAYGQSGPFAGLDPAVRQIGLAIDGGDPSQITSALAQGQIIQTAFPGDGVPVARADAAAKIPPRIVSSPGRSDALGAGEFRLLAVWISRVTPNEILLMGSGLDSTGQRQSTVFAAEARDGSWKISGWGPVLDTEATLAQWAAQGDLRRVEGGLAPLPPATGSTGRDEASPTPGWPFAVLGLVAILVAAGAARASRRSGS